MIRPIRTLARARLMAPAALLATLLATLLLPLAACAQATTERSTRTTTRTTTTPGWREIARTPSLVAFIDTARVDRPTPSATRVWFRFEYVVPLVIRGDSTIQYRASETHEEIDCAHRRTRDLAMRLESVEGVTGGAPFLDSTAQSVDGHPLGSGMFVAACRTLGQPMPDKAP
jgi:hypothetical protein